MRRSEILLVLLIDMAYYHTFPDAVEGVGYGLVLVSVLGMALAGDIQQWLNTNLCSKERNSSQSQQPI